jgi:hypothetical protein
MCWTRRPQRRRQVVRCVCRMPRGWRRAEVALRSPPSACRARPVVGPPSPGQDSHTAKAPAHQEARVTLRRSRRAAQSGSARVLRSCPRPSMLLPPSLPALRKREGEEDVSCPMMMEREDDGVTYIGVLLASRWRVLHANLAGRSPGRARVAWQVLGLPCRVLVYAPCTRLLNFRAP